MIKKLSVAIGVFWLAAAAFFAASSQVAQWLPAPQESLGGLSQELGLPFPASTRLLGVLRENGMDDWIAIKVEMTDSDLTAFLAASPVQPERMLPGDHGYFGPDRSFWDPQRAVGLRAAQAAMPGARALNIGVSTSHSGIVCVYIVNHGT